MSKDSILNSIGNAFSSRIKNHILGSFTLIYIALNAKKLSVFILSNTSERLILLNKTENIVDVTLLLDAVFWTSAYLVLTHILLPLIQHILNYTSNVIIFYSIGKYDRQQQNKELQIKRKINASANLEDSKIEPDYLRELNIKELHNWAEEKSELQQEIIHLKEALLITQKENDDQTKTCNALKDTIYKLNLKIENTEIQSKHNIFKDELFKTFNIQAYFEYTKHAHSTIIASLHFNEVKIVVDAMSDISELAPFPENFKEQMTTLKAEVNTKPILSGYLVEQYLMLIRQLIIIKNKYPETSDNLTFNCDLLKATLDDPNSTYTDNSQHGKQRRQENKDSVLEHINRENEKTRYKQ